MPSRPLVSVAMATFNSDKTVAQTIQSLLCQTYSEWELLLIDDGSSDRTLSVVRGFRDERIRVVEGGRNLGLAVRLNEAIALARGEYIARIDADDLAFPARFDRQARYLLEHPDVDLLGTAAVVFRGDGEVVGLLACGPEHEEICRRPWNGFNSLIHPTWMGKRSWFQRYRFNPGLRKSQDRDILLRAFRDSRFACLPDVLAGYRQESLSLGKILKSRAYFSTILGAAALRDRDPRFLWGILTQGLKAATDIFAVTTGFNYRLLRHRAAPVPASLVEEWRDVWRRCSAGAEPPIE